MRKIERHTVRCRYALRDSLSKSYEAFGVEIDTENNRHRAYWVRRNSKEVEYYSWMPGMPDLSDGSSLRELNRGRWYPDEPTKWARKVKRL